MFRSSKSRWTARTPACRVSSYGTDGICSVEKWRFKQQNHGEINAIIRGKRWLTTGFVIFVRVLTIVYYPSQIRPYETVQNLPWSWNINPFVGITLPIWSGSGEVVIKSRQGWKQLLFQPFRPSGTISSSAIKRRPLQIELTFQSEEFDDP